MVGSLQELKELIEEITDDDVVVFENPDFCTAFVGLSHDGRAIYDYDKMIEYMIREQGVSVEEAVDHISYDTIRSLGYMHNGPIVLMGL